MSANRLHRLADLALLLVLIGVLGTVGVWSLTQVVRAGASGFASSGRGAGADSSGLTISEVAPPSRHEQVLMEIRRLHLRAGRQAGADDPSIEMPAEALESIPGLRD